jgi:hypothetical protein
MCIVFVEYQIQDEMRASYLHYMQKAKVQTGLKIYEGTDVWKPLESWIKGGLEKIHMWHFSAAI